MHVLASSRGGQSHSDISHSKIFAVFLRSFFFFSEGSEGKTVDTLRCETPESTAVCILTNAATCHEWIFPPLSSKQTTYKCRRTNKGQLFLVCHWFHCRTRRFISHELPTVPDSLIDKQSQKINTMKEALNLWPWFQQTTTNALPWPAVTQRGQSQAWHGHWAPVCPRASMPEKLVS